MLGWRTSYSNEWQDGKKLFSDLYPRTQGSLCIFPFLFFFILPYILPFSLVFRKFYTFHVSIWFADCFPILCHLKNQNQLLSEVSRETDPKSYLLMTQTRDKEIFKRSKGRP